MPQDTLKEILKHHPQEKDRKLIVEAFEFAKSAHDGQKRLSGEDYIIHPLRTALTLSHLKLDARTVAAAILHDVLDDTKVSPEELEKKFGKEITLLVKGVSRLGKLRLPRQNLEIAAIEKRTQKPANFEVENLRRMFFAMAEDVRVILIKLADRAHNMETLQFIPAEKQKRIALETLEIFSPLANRLGIRTIQTKLENLAFPYLYPKEYQWFKENLQETRQEERKYLEKTRATLTKILEKEKIPFLEIQARLKSSFSLYQKLTVRGMSLDQIFDRMALRVIVQDVKTCYEILGVIHKYWRPLPGRIKDYIAFPKPNGYQSLHTTVFADQGKILEVQIRTEAMHEIAEHGICAHWAKKEGVNLGRQAKRFAWIEQLAGWQKEISSQKEYLEGLKIDFFKNRIFVLTPRGDIIDLPEGACAVDFAYNVHSEIGNHCIGAKANGKIISLSSPLKNGDVVEILLNKKRGPSRDWLKFVKTGLARSHIKKQTEVNFFKGLQELKDRIFPAKSVAPRPRPEREVLPTKAKPVLKPTILVCGKTNVAHFLARCCKPRAGDPICAYLTKTKGASIHLQTCQNLKRLKSHFPEKIVDARWQI